MWTKTFSKLYSDVNKEAIWRAWCDVNHWPKWDTELEYCKLDAAFEVGSTFTLKPKKGPKVKITLSEIIKHEHFTDYCCFPGAKMYVTHQLKEEVEGIRITNTITMKGPLSFIWRRLVATKIAESVPHQTDNLVAYVKSYNA